MGSGLRCGSKARSTYWPKLQSAWSQGKAHGSTASVVTKVATEDCQTGSSSDTPHVATEYGLSVSTKRVTFGVGPKEALKSNNETGQDKYPRKATRHMLRTATQKERRSNLRVVRRILSQSKKVRRSHLKVATRIPSL